VINKALTLTAFEVAANSAVIRPVANVIAAIAT